MTVKELESAVEAILFAAGEPVEVSRIAQVLEIDDENAESILLNIAALYEERDGGLCVVRMDDMFQICTKKKYSEQIRSILDIKRNAPLSQAAFEVLAVISYNQPITKAYVEQVRGVDCTGVITTLCQKGLIEEKGRLELPGRPLIYGTTAEFLKCFGISSLNDLPEIPELAEKESELSIQEEQVEIMKEDMERELVSQH